MLSLQREVERIINHSGDYDHFVTDEQFVKTYRLSNDTLSLTRINDVITVIISDVHFEFKRLTYNPSWYPIHVVKDNEVISIVIDYENGRAHSARNWNRFQDLAEEMSKMITGRDVEVLNQCHQQINEKPLFKQISFW